MFQLIFCSVILAVTSASVVHHRPSYLVPCSKSKDFEACAMKHAEQAMPHMLNGDKKLGLPRFKPLRISAIDVNGNNNFHVHLADLKVYGLEHARPLKITVDFEKRKAKIMSTVPRLMVIGQYTMDGKILIFSLNGHGPVNITLTNGMYEYEFDWTTEMRDGVEYGKISNSKFDYHLKGVEYQFDNVINGEKLLSRQVNMMLNKNWEIVNEDLKDSIRETLLIIHNQLFEIIFTQIPIKELFLD